MAWHEQDNQPHYLFKLRLTKNLKRAVARLKEEELAGLSQFWQPTDYENVFDELKKPVGLKRL